jgi:spermidine synthase
MDQNDNPYIAEHGAQLSHHHRAALIRILSAVIIWLFVFGSAFAIADDALVAKIESLYNYIELYKRPSDGYFVLTFVARRLHYGMSIVNPRDPLELPIAYTQLMTVAAAYSEGLSDAAMIGFGGGRTSWYLHESIPELRFSAVELDPAVVQIGARYLGVKSEPNFEINTIDGRMFLTRTDKSFDIILVDAYRGPFVPFHLATREFFVFAKKRLKAGGVLVQNVEPSAMLFDSAVATISSVFSNLDFYRSDSNIVVVAYDGPRKDAAELQRAATERQSKYNFRYNLVGLLKQQYVPAIDWSKRPLTDDFAPVEYLTEIERHE